MATLYAVKRPDGSWTGDSLSRALENCKPGTSWEIRIKRILPTRSNNQNRWYFGVVLPIIAQETGDDEESIHESLLMKFASKRVKSKKDKRFSLVVAKRSKSMNTAEFSEYVEKIRVWVASFGITIPDPIS